MPPLKPPFIAVTERAFTRLVNEQYALLRRSIAAQERLQRIVLSERGLDAIVAGIAALVGGPAIVILSVEAPPGAMERGAASVVTVALAGATSSDSTNDLSATATETRRWPLFAAPLPGFSAQLAQTAEGSRAQAVDRAIDSESPELTAWLETFEIPHRKTNHKAAESFDTVLARGLYGD